MIPAIQLNEAEVFCSPIEAIRKAWQLTGELNTIIPSTDSQDDNRVFDLGLAFEEPDSEYVTIEDLGATNSRNSSGNEINAVPFSETRNYRIVVRANCNATASTMSRVMRESFHRGVSAFTELGTLNSLSLKDNRTIFSGSWVVVSQVYEAKILVY